MLIYVSLTDRRQMVGILVGARHPTVRMESTFAMCWFIFSVKVRSRLRYLWDEQLYPLLHAVNVAESVQHGLIFQVSSSSDMLLCPWSAILLRCVP